MTVGEKIKSIRKKNKISQQELGNMLGVSQAMIAQYENGKRIPKLETIKKIAIALDCEVSDIDENIFVIKLPKYELTPKRLEKARLDSEARELIERWKPGENLTNEEQKKNF